MKNSMGYTVVCHTPGFAPLSITCRNETDRNEMALALWEEQIYWLYTLISMIGDSVNMAAIKRMAHESILFFETILVED